MNKRKAEAGVIVAMTIIGFISVGISLDAMINVANNAFGTGFTPTAGTQAGEFESTISSICDGDIDDSDTLRMSTTESNDFQVQFSEDSDDFAEDAYVKYWHTGLEADEDDYSEHEELYDSGDGCGVAKSDSQETLNPGVTYTVEKIEDDLVVVQ